MQLQAPLPPFPSGGLHSNSSRCLRVPYHSSTWLGMGELDRVFCMLSSNRIAPSTASSYRTRVSHYMNFCSSYRLSPFLLAESTLCCSVAFLVLSGLSRIHQLDHTYPPFVIVSYVMVVQILPSAPSSSYTSSARTSVKSSISRST